jgi:hypothetical protein
MHTIGHENTIAMQEQTICLILNSLEQLQHKLSTKPKPEFQQTTCYDVEPLCLKELGASLIKETEIKLTTIKDTPSVRNSQLNFTALPGTEKHAGKLFSPRMGKLRVPDFGRQESPMHELTQQDEGTPNCPPAINSNDGQSP